MPSCIHKRLFLRRLCTLCAYGYLASVAQADTVMLGASKDNSLFNDDQGSVSNGVGNLFAGRTGGQGPGPLRALLAFDIAAHVPMGATVTDVQLTLTVLQASTDIESDGYSLHRVEQDWGEGDSLATSGRGAPAATGDATWNHTFYDGSTWFTPGGDFASTPSVSQSLGGSGPVTWGSTVQMVADAQAWLDDPKTAFGWILIGDETRFGSARRFGSSESDTSAPLLTVTFTPVPEPSLLAVVIFPTVGGFFLAGRHRRSSTNR